MHASLGNPYTPIEVDLQICPRINDDLLIDVSHPLWKRLQAAGARLSGDTSVYPVQFGEEVGNITYRVRHAFQYAGDCDLGGYTLLAAIKAGDAHPFWREVGLPGVPYLWGSAAIVYYLAEQSDGSPIARVLLGKKLPKSLMVPATFANTLTPPAGIVDFGDFEDCLSLEDALIKAAMRECHEETGLDLENLGQLQGIRTFREEVRCKQQAFVFFQLDAPAEIPGGTEPELIECDFYENIAISREGVQGFTLLSDLLPKRQ